MVNLPQAFRADICHRTFDTLTNVIGTELGGGGGSESENGGIYGYVSGSVLMKN